MKYETDPYNTRMAEMTRPIDGRPVYEQVAFDDAHEALKSAIALVSDLLETDDPVAVAIVGAALFKAAHADRRLIEPDPQQDLFEG